MKDEVYIVNINSNYIIGYVDPDRDCSLTNTMKINYPYMMMSHEGSVVLRPMYLLNDNTYIELNIKKFFTKPIKPSKEVEELYLSTIEYDKLITADVINSKIKAERLALDSTLFNKRITNLIESVKDDNEYMRKVIDYKMLMDTEPPTTAIN